MSSEIAIKVERLSKCFQIYEQPRDRLKQFVFPRMQSLLGQSPRNFFREFWAVKEVSFEVRKGETVGIVGRNGSGKSTLLQMICGTLNPSGGLIQTNGRIAALLELGSGFNPEFTGRENVYLNASLLGLDRKETDERFDSIADFADIGQFIDQPTKTYSSGMVVRLAFAVAINADPQILVVDEALSVGDELFQRKCFSRIEAIRAKGATILFVSHSGSTVVELCDRALLLDNGENLAAGTPKHIIGCYQKLLYAPVEKRAAIRKEISENSSIDETKLLPLLERAEPAPNTPASQELNESFDPSLRPSSTIAYESHGALIQGASIFTQEDEEVNNLIRGKTYRYKYHINFERSASNVRFGMMIKTTSGVELGGGVSASSPEKGLPYVNAGSKYCIEFTFECRLIPGTYFLNAGLVGNVNGSEVYLHRLIDAAMFRVLPETELLTTGIVDFACRAKINHV